MTTSPGHHRRAPSLADLDALPPGVVGEIIEGVLYTMTKPRFRHQRIATQIGGRIGHPYDDLARLWWIIIAPGIELPGGTLEISPDVAGWRRERMPVPPDDEPIRVVPDWVCEILSPSTRKVDLEIKLPYYAKIGVAYAWIVDRLACTVTAYHLDAGRWVTLGVYRGDNGSEGIEPFELLPLDVANWWLEKGNAP